MNAPAHRRFAFVLPRFGEGIAGGAETLAGNLARRVSQSGHAVEVLTTCARDNRTWENELDPGESIEYGLRVHRFPVDPRDLETWIPLQIAVSEGMRLSVDQQLAWMAESVNSAAMYDHIWKSRDRFDAFVFCPYLFGTTFWGSLICPQKSLLIPCLHDEHYAYTDVLRSMFRQVRGALFNAVPEQELAARLCGTLRGGEVGMGFEPFPEHYAAELEPYFDERFPYVLYVGRKETGKNVQLLIDHFLDAKGEGAIPDSVRLVIAGGGDFSDLHRPAAAARPDIVDLPQVSEREKHRLMRHSTYLCQPSVNESFSIVLMEAWLLGTPVVVHAACPVTRHHAVESGGGLYFADPHDFVGVTNALLEDRELRQRLASSGNRYVRERYGWSAVLERFEQVVGMLLDDESHEQARGREADQ